MDSYTRHTPSMRGSRGVIHVTVLLRSVIVSVLLLNCVRAATWIRPAACTEPCDENGGLCLTASCQDAWDTCSEGFMETQRTATADPADFYDNGCGVGGCDRPGFEETEKKLCAPCAYLVCYQETCCRTRPRVTCCQQLTCTQKLDECQMPQQRSLTNSSVSLVYTTTIASNNSASFPFYSVPAVYGPPGTTCDSVRVWGMCSCLDGVPLPGCAINDSHTWDALEGEGLLPGGLSLTCIALPLGLSPASHPNPPVSPDSGSSGASAPGSSEGEHPETQRRSMSRNTLIGIVVGTAVGLALLAGAAVALVVARGRAQDARWKADRQQHYQAVVTGAVQTNHGLGVLANKKSSWAMATGRARQAMRSISAKWRRLLFRHGDTSKLPSGAQARYMQGLASSSSVAGRNTGAEGAVFSSMFPHTLQGPALPVDLEDEMMSSDLYTLEDLDVLKDEQDRGAALYQPQVPLPSRRPGSSKATYELELGQREAAGPSSLGKQPLLQPALPSSHHTIILPKYEPHPQHEVIHTQSVQLAPPGGVLGRGSTFGPAQQQQQQTQQPQQRQQGEEGAPLTPQTTGGGHPLGQTVRSGQGS